MAGVAASTRPKKRRGACRTRKNRTRRLRYLRIQARRLARRAGLRSARRTTPWWIEFPDELRLLEYDLSPEYDHFERAIVGRAIVFRGDVNLDPLPLQRRIAVIFPGRPSRVRPIVMADGPRTPRHRFTSHRPRPLCMWYSGDEPDMQWRLGRGLTGLIDIARVHLFREARFRQTGRWRGPEVHLKDGVVPQNRALRRAQLRDGRRTRCWCGSGRRYIRCHGGIAPERELAILGIGETASATPERGVA
jgi:SEC-C motif